MTNKEFYADKIMEIACEGQSVAVDKCTHKPVSCGDIDCDNCVLNKSRPDCPISIEEWANAEYVSFVDWSKVEVDTPIFVSNFKFTALNKGEKRHFAKYENGKVYVFEMGKTSWTTDRVAGWEYARLATDEELKKEAENE